MTTLRAFRDRDWLKAGLEPEEQAGGNADGYVGNPYGDGNGNGFDYNYSTTSFSGDGFGDGLPFSDDDGLEYLFPHDGTFARTSDDPFELLQHVLP